MKIQIITLFPEAIEPYLRTSMLWKASKEGLAEFSCINLRDFGLGSRHQVDDTPYGGGDGMLLMIEPLSKAVAFSKSKDISAKVILMTPRGSLWKQANAKKYAKNSKNLIIICARYEGYDERITNLVDEQISIGNYILTGGELPALVVADSVVRLLPGVLGGETSADIESFSDGKTLEYPQYTRPEVFAGKSVPPVLLSGNHSEIEKWRKNNSTSLDRKDN